MIISGKSLHAQCNCIIYMNIWIHQWISSCFHWFWNDLITPNSDNNKLVIAWYHLLHIYVDIDSMAGIFFHTRLASKHNNIESCVWRNYIERIFFFFWIQSMWYSKTNHVNTWGLFGILVGTHFQKIQFREK